MENALTRRPQSAPIMLPARSSREGTIELLLHVVFKRWRLVAAVFLAFVIAAAVVVVRKAPVRTAIAKVLLKPSRMAAQLSAADAGRWAFPDQIIDSEIELMLSRDVLLPVVEQENPQLTGNDRELEVERMRSHLFPVNARNTSVIEVTYAAQTESEAERVLSSVLDQYLTRHTAVYTGSAELLGFYQHEKSRLAGELEAAEEARRSWQAKNDVVSIDEQITDRLQLLTAQQKQLDEARADNKVGLQQDPLVSRLQGDLMTLDTALGDLRQRYTEQDLRVVQMVEKRALLERQIVGAQERLRAARANRESTLADQIAQSDQELDSLREKKLAGERLNRAVDLTRDAYVRYEKNVEEARVAARLDNQRLSNISVIEQPHANRGTDFVQRAGFFVLSDVVGIVVAILLALALSLLRPSLHSRRDVETHLALPVLALIPDMSDMEERTV